MENIADDDIAGLIVAIIKNEIEQQYKRGTDFVEGIVTSVSPLTVNVNGVELDGEWIKKLKNISLQINDNVLLGKKIGGQMYYILGVIE